MKEARSAPFCKLKGVDGGMAIEDLDLEFEDENEKKGDGSLDPGVELDFSAGVAEKAPEARAVPVADPAVASLDQARAQKNAIAAKPTGPAQAVAAIKAQAQPVSSSQMSADIAKVVEQKVAAGMQAATAKMQQEISQKLTQELALVKTEIAKINIPQASSGDNSVVARLNEADIKVAVAKNETEFLVDYISEAKLLEYKINQTLLQVHAKNPAFQKEILSIKKLLQDHLNKYKKEPK